MDSLSLSLDNGQLRLYLIRYNAGRTMITGVGNDLHLHDWVRVVLKLSTNTYTLEGNLISFLYYFFYVLKTKM